MPYDDHLRLTLAGAIRTSGSPTEVERWSVRLNLSHPSIVLADSFTADRAADYAADCVSFWTDPNLRQASVTTLDEVKVASIGPDGKYTDEPFIVPVAAVGGVDSALIFPPQIALAVSLETDRRGPTGKGRMYLPSPVTAMQADFSITLAHAEGIRLAVKTFLDNINNVPGADVNGPQVVVASSKGYNTNVTGVRVGRKLDTIRSRRASLDEAYTASLAVA